MNTPPNVQNALDRLPGGLHEAKKNLTETYSLDTRLFKSDEMIDDAAE